MKYNPTIVVAFWQSEKLPCPVAEYKFCETRKWRFDFAFVEEKVAVEVEGGIWSGGRHTRGSGFTKDMEKYNEAACMGWRVLRFQPNDVCLVDTVNTIKRALASKLQSS